MIQPGEMYMADIPPGQQHRVVVVSREDLNRGKYVIAALITSQKFAVRSTLANCVPLQPLAKLDDIQQFPANHFPMQRRVISAFPFVMPAETIPSWFFYLTNWAKGIADGCPCQEGTQGSFR